MLDLGALGSKDTAGNKTYNSHAFIFWKELNKGIKERNK